MEQEQAEPEQSEQSAQQQRRGVSNPHDAMFREVLGKPTNAASQLRAVLPAELAGRLDLDRLARCSGSFVDEDLRWRHTDLLFTAPLDGREAFVYVLIEHQSKTHPMMAFRMLCYMMRIWDRYLKDNPSAKKLPIVIPIVVHHNKRPWHAPTELYDLLELDDETVKGAGEYLPRFRFLLEDLATMDDVTLLSPPLAPPAQIALVLLKTVAYTPELVPQLRRWADVFKEVLNGPDGRHYIAVFLNYIREVADPPDDELYDLFAELGPEAKEVYMTTADRLRAEGRVEGEAKGEVKGQAKALLRLLTRKFGPLSPAELDAVNTASADQIDTWTDRILTADTLDDVLR